MRHKQAVEQFVTDVRSLECSTKVRGALEKRIERNKYKLFTFIDYNGGPWSNNNAEHAVRAFTPVRNGIATSAAKGTTERPVSLLSQSALRAPLHDPASGCLS